MRQSEGLPPDPDMLAELETIDATLAGLAIDPAHAEIAELTLLLAAERPRIAPEFGAELDARVQRRFATATATATAIAIDIATTGTGVGTGSDADAAVPTGGGDRTSRRRRAGRVGSFLRTPGFGAGVAAVLAATALAVVVVHDNGGPATPANRTPTPDVPALTTAAGAVSRAAKPRNNTPVPGPEKSTPASHGAASGAALSTGSAGVAATSTGSSGASSAGSSGASSSPSAAPPALSPAPTPNGRRQVQSAQLQLTSSNGHFNAVSQEVFDVVGQENGIVKNSSVTAASGNESYASFTLSIPSQNLQTTMTRLSALRYATVASRTDATQDVNSQYLNDQGRLADARALRTSLLKQLANAITQAEIDSITAQLHDAEATISRDEGTLAHLQSRISFSSLSVQINAGPVIVHPVAKPAKSGGFTIGKAAHDSVRVLTVAAGVALIALAALVPFALLAALVAWAAYSLRRRRREHALDTA